MAGAIAAIAPELIASVAPEVLASAAPEAAGAVGGGGFNLAGLLGGGGEQATQGFGLGQQLPVGEIQGQPKGLFGLGGDQQASTEAVTKAIAQPLLPFAQQAPLPQIPAAPQQSLAVLQQIAAANPVGGSFSRGLF